MKILRVDSDKEILELDSNMEKEVELKAEGYSIINLDNETKVALENENLLDEELFKELKKRNGNGIEKKILEVDNELYVENNEGEAIALYPADEVKQKGYYSEKNNLFGYNHILSFKNSWRSSQYKLNEEMEFEFFGRKPEKPWLSEGLYFINKLNGKVVKGFEFLNHVDNSRTGLTEWWAGKIPPQYEELSQINAEGYAFKYQSEERDYYVHIKYDNKLREHVAVIDDPTNLELFIVHLKGLKYVLPNLEKWIRDNKFESKKRFIKIKDVDLDTQEGIVEREITFNNLVDGKDYNNKEIKRLARSIWGTARSVKEISATWDSKEDGKEWSWYTDDFGYRVTTKNFPREVEDNIVFEIIHFNPRTYDYEKEKSVIKREDYYKFPAKKYYLNEEDKKIIIYKYRNQISVYSYHAGSLTDEKEMLKNARRKAKRDWINSQKEKTDKEKIKRILEENPKETLRVEDSIKAGNCEVGTKNFRDEYFGSNREEVKFEEILNKDYFDEILENKDFRATIAYKMTG